MKKKVSLLLVSLLIFVLTLGGCGFSVGTKSKSEDYKSLFPDRAAKLSGAYKTSNVSYVFTVGDYEMMVHVDTSEGHSFEVVSSPAGFDIKDKNGDVTIQARCMEKDKYAEYSAQFTDTKKINGRKFFVEEADGAVYACSYMADCGMDYGLYMKAANKDDLELVAFRGEALEGASSDPAFYQGKVSETTTETSAETSTEVSTQTSTEVSETTSAETSTEPGDGKESVTTYALSDEIKSKLESLDTDFNKIYWGVAYSISEEMPGVVVSVSMVQNYGTYELIVGITNLYDKEISFAANAEAADSDSNIIGTTYMYNSCIGSGNTVINTIYCGDDMPDGRIRWTEVEVDDSLYVYTPWQGDFGASGNSANGYLDVTYTLESLDGSAFYGNMVYVLLLDENGFILGYDSSYIEDVEAGAKAEDTVSIYGEEVYLALTKNVAVFANPVEP